MNKPIFDKVLCPFCWENHFFEFTDEGKQEYKCKCGAVFKKLGPGRWKVINNNFKWLIKTGS